MRLVAIAGIGIVIGCVAVLGLWAGGQAELTREPNVVIHIDGMYCNLCTKAVRKSLLQVDGVEEAVVSLEEKKALLIVVGEVLDEAFSEAVRRAGAGEYSADRIDRIKGTGS